MNLVYTLPFTFKINFNILSSPLRTASPNEVFVSFHSKFGMSFIMFPLHSTCSTIRISFHQASNIFGVE
jgi:hypothetical protein